MNVSHSYHNKIFVLCFDDDVLSLLALNCYVISLTSLSLGWEGCGVCVAAVCFGFHLCLFCFGDSW